MQTKMTKNEAKAQSMIIEGVEMIKRTKKWRELTKHSSDGAEYTFITEIYKDLSHPEKNRVTKVVIMEKPLNKARGQFPWKEDDQNA